MEFIGIIFRIATIILTSREILHEKLRSLVGGPMSVVLTKLNDLENAANIAETSKDAPQGLKR